MTDSAQQNVRIIDVDNLNPVQDPPRSLFHISGAKIHEAHEPLDAERIAMMREAGLTHLAVLFNGATSDDLKRMSSFDNVSTDQLGDGTMTLVKDLYDSRGNILVRRGIKMTKSLINTLHRKSPKFYIRKSTDIQEKEAVRKYRNFLEEFQDLRLKFDRPLTSLKELSLIPQGEKISLKNLDWRIEKGFETIGPSGLPLIRKVRERDKFRPRLRSEIEIYSSLKRNALNAIDSNFDQIIKNKELDRDGFMSLATRIVNALVNDKEMLFNTINIKTNEEYTKAHTINTCIIALQIATALGYDDRQVMEIAFGALLNDIGMHQVPKSILSKKESLTTNEWLEIKKHPIHSINYLTQFSNLPRSTPIVAYQVHERLDGSGYPKGRKGHLIHDFSRIVAIADVYDALINKRAWRDGYIPYRAMEELLTLCQTSKLDSRILRVFLTYMGLFPVGSWVRLNNGSVGQVTGLTDQENYDRPSVTILFEDDKPVSRPLRVFLNERKDLKIVEAIDPEKLDIEDPFIGF